MDISLESLSIDELKKINKQCIKIINNKNQAKYIMKVDNIKNNKRLDNYLNKTKITEYSFLYKNINDIQRNNFGGSLSLVKSLFYHENNEIMKNYGIENEEQLFNAIISFDNPILYDDEFIKMVNDVKKLSYLDKLFNNEEMIHLYEATYNSYLFLKNHLRKCLDDNSNESDYNLIYKDYELKKKIVSNNINEIASTLLILRNKIKNSKCSICNMGLSKMAKKEKGTQITMQQIIFVECIALVLSLEDLENKNYEDAKKLIYVPYQKIVS